MSHKEQVIFCKRVKNLYPEYFRRKTVVDVGSLDINGNNKRFFKNCNYLGIDLIPGKNVDIIGPAHEVLKAVGADYSAKYKKYFLKSKIDTIISTEALEHDRHIEDTLTEMYKALRKGGLLVITAGGDGREEHGTTEKHSWCSPATNDYYKNVSNEMFLEILPPNLFDTYFINQNEKSQDFQFFGLKKRA